MGITFYVMVVYLNWPIGRFTRSKLKKGRHLQEHIGGHYKNSGSPEGRKLRGDGGLVVAKGGLRALHFVKGSRCVSIKTSLPAGLEGLGNLCDANRTNPELVNTKVLKLMSDPSVLMASYSKLKSSPGNMTPGIDNETLDGLNLDWFSRLGKDLNTNKFQFRPARRLEIPKPNDKGTKPLGIASPRDKIVQGAMALVLEAIFEPSFSTLLRTHGFRPGRGCHSALGEIKRTYTGVNWFIEGDISKCFDSFDHKLLLELVNKRVNDKGFMDLMHKALKAGYLYQGKFFAPDIGTPQGSIVSPILCNILLTQLDVFIENLRAEFEIGKRHRVNPEWRRLTRVGNIKEVHRLNISSRMHSDTNYKRLKYVRYANDFIIGVTGNQLDCISIRDKIQKFLLSDLRLNLSLEKTKITHARTDRAHFLGTYISLTELDKRPFKTITRGGTTFLSKVATRPQLLAPIRKLVKKLEDKGIARRGGQPTR